jgi:hypothetical protein
MLSEKQYSLRVGELDMSMLTGAFKLWRLQMPEEKLYNGGEGSMYSSAMLFVRLNQGEINSQDKQEDWRNSEMHMKFWLKTLYGTDS